MRKIILGGNWKMQITEVKNAVKIAKEIADAMKGITSVDVFIAPSFTDLHAVGKAITGTNLKLAGQNVYFREKGAFTGEISIDSLVDVGCEYIILGHSERRRIFGESDDYINKKVLKVLEKGLRPVLCLGETAKEREDGKTAEVIKRQLAGSLNGVTETMLLLLVIAYEPVWAINNKFLNPDTEIKPATTEQANAAHRIVREWFQEIYGKDAADRIQIQYGGSMKPTNAKELLTLGNVDGGLIGGASLKAETFVPIINFAVELSK